ncbi:MAG: DUF4249 family protein [Flavobacteriales bacterium]|jgi:hypothetical protein|nr:DUF4249 family protein [Flavobacteriales bacterium]MBP7449740.1 DUF4249 family protein [Flavobacteriales bacterium]
MHRSVPILGILVTLLSASCSTDLEINAPYKETTVVYALFNMSEDTHYVKINRAFQGEGNALDYAQISDSSEYGAEDIELAEVVRISNGVEVASFPLQPITVTGREPGTFYGPEQRLYYFVGTPQTLPIINTTVYLDPASEYKVRLRVKGQDISASTVVVNDFTIAQNDFNLDNEVNLMAPTGGGYGQYEFNWTSRTHGKRYVVRWRVRYDEVRGQDTIPKEVMQDLGSKVALNSSQPETMALILPGATFYSTLASRIPVDASVDKRIFKGLDFLVTVASDEFHTYLNLTQPISGIIEDRPSYTNVDGGLGIVASRYTKSVIGKRLNPNSFIELATGAETGQLNFCFGTIPGSVYSCN